MCSWFTLENITAYRGAILGFVGGSGALILAILEFRKPEADRKKWIAWLELFVAISFFGQSVNDVWQVNADAEQQRITARHFDEIDPAKRPIKTVTASVHIELKGASTNRAMEDVPCPSDLYFIPRGMNTENSFLMLDTATMKTLENECFMEFTWSLPQKFLFPPEVRSAERGTAFVDRCRLLVWCVTGSPLEITGGEATLTLNSFVQKTFIFPPQKAKDLGLIGNETLTNTPRFIMK